MSIEWFTNSKNKYATIYDTNITLNTVAAENFKTCFATLVGFDIDTNTLLIKALSKEEASTGKYYDSDLHPISIKPSYGRINGKNIIKKLCNFFPLDFTGKQSYKFECDWSSSDKTLHIHLGEEVL